MTLPSRIALILLAGAVFSASSWCVEDTPSSDLLVYGGTASGVITAYSAAKEGLRGVLLEPGTHFGGTVTGELSATDVGHASIIGGYACGFYTEAAAHYGTHNLGRLEDWFSEPHVAEAILQKMLQDAGVRVFHHEKLLETHGVERKGRRIVSITTIAGQRWRAKVFADCSYDGDLMAKAQMSYTWAGRVRQPMARTSPECAVLHPTPIRLATGRP
jgi:NADPH-dependent 2,4-dienoyl-CoA reductase/sulfur reductase-like enzyme